VGLQVVGLLLATALSPLWVPILLIAAPIYAVAKGIVPTHWLAVEWLTYVIVGGAVMTIQRRRRARSN
jgi:hypothetical protein